MWARHLELALGCWLALSPFVFRHAPEATWLWINDLTAALAVILLALLSHGRGLRRAHLLVLPVALWLLALGWWCARGEPTPASQNHIVIGLLLIMLGIVPSDASQPPPGWRAASPEEHRR